MNHLTLLLLLAFAACSPQPPEDAAQVERWEAAIEGVEYEVIKAAKQGTQKLTIEVLLEAPITEPEIEALARLLRHNNGGDSAERTFVGFRIDGMASQQGAWATGHFTPDLNVAILGGTGPNADALREGRAAGGPVWYDPSMGGGTAWIVSSPDDASTSSLVWVYHDGSRRVVRLRRVSMDGKQGTTFQETDGEDCSWVAHPGGDLLCVYPDNEEPFLKMRPVALVD